MTGKRLPEDRPVYKPQTDQLTKDACLADSLGLTYGMYKAYCHIGYISTYIEQRKRDMKKWGIEEPKKKKGSRSRKSDILGRYATKTVIDPVDMEEL